jgi:quinol monooxygenase YgiN
MLTTIARGRLLVAHRDHGFDVLRRMVEMDEDEPGTLVQAFHLDESDPAAFWAYELWQDDAALELHRDRQRGLPRSWRRSSTAPSRCTAASRCSARELS